MLRLNIRQTQAQIGMRIDYARLDSHVRPAELHGEYVAPRSEIGLDQPEIEIDSYPSRHSYGFTSHADFAKQYEQKGFSGVQEGTARFMREAWRRAENGAKPGRDAIAESYDRRLSEEIRKERVLVAEFIPNPEIHITPVRTHGGTDPGSYKMRIRSYPKAEVQYHAGRAETYVKQKGDVKQWLTEDRYDIYA